MNAQPRAAALALARGRAWRAVVAALPAEARRRSATTASVRVTAGNAPALAVHRHVGFSPSHEYWYRAPAGEQH